MKKCIFFGLFISLLMTSSITMAAREKLFPKGCSPETTQFEYNLLYLGTKPDKGQNRVFVIKNSVYQPVMVTQDPEQSPFASHLNAVINPGSWSAIITEQDNFKMQCYDPSGIQPQQVDCSRVVNACELRVAPIMHSARGQYWITKNQYSQSTLFAQLRESGIFP